MGIPIETVKTDAYTMNYIRFGQGELPLVILPGLSVQSVLAAADAIANAYRSLTDACTIYLFDRQSELSPEVSIRTMARDTAGALTALGLENVCLFGASQGGMIAMTIAIEYPALVKKLILGSTAAKVDLSQNRAIAQWIACANAEDAPALYQAFGQAIYPPPVFEKLRSLLSAQANTVTKNELRRFALLAQAADGFDVTDALSAVTCPALVLGDKTDRVFGAQASRRIAERLPNAELYLYDGYGHAAYDTAPDYKEIGRAHV